MIPAVSDVLTSVALFMTGEVEARAVITRIEGRIEDWKVGRFPARLALNPASALAQSVAGSLAKGERYEEPSPWRRDCDYAGGSA